MCCTINKFAVKKLPCDDFVQMILFSVIGRMRSLKSANQVRCQLHSGIQLMVNHGMALDTILLTVIGYLWIFLWTVQC